MATQIFLQTRAKSQIHNLTHLTLHVKELEKGTKRKSDAESWPLRGCISPFPCLAAGGHYSREGRRRRAGSHREHSGAPSNSSSRIRGFCPGEGSWQRQQEMSGRVEARRGLCCSEEQRWEQQAPPGMCWGLQPPHSWLQNLPTCPLSGLQEHISRMR